MNLTKHMGLIMFFQQILFICILSNPYSDILAQNNDSFTVGNLKAEPGKKVSGKLIVKDGIDKGTFIPISIINGVKPGPVLTLSAGVHGTEYVPVISLQKLVKEISPDELSGTLILIHIANMPSFKNRAIYLSQVDYKNLNRIFPGKKDGTVTERIAHTLTNEIMSKSDYFIDLHGGESNERVVDFLYYCSGSSESELCSKSKQMALAMGNKYLIPYEYFSVLDSVKSEYSDQAAFRAGAAAITLEWGDMGVVKPEELDFALKGIKNVMISIDMLEGTPTINPNPVYLVNEQKVKSNYDGILYTLIDKGLYITKGTLLGYTTDYWGNILEEYRSPVNGILVAIKVAPAINKGEDVFSVAEPVESYDK